MASYTTAAHSTRKNSVSMTLINCRFILVLGLVSMYFNQQVITHFFENTSLLSLQKNPGNLRSTLLRSGANNGILESDLMTSSVPSSLERKVSQQLLQNLQQPMPKATNGVQYSVNKFQLSLGHSTAFEYSLHSRKTNHTIVIYNSTSMEETDVENIKSIVCELHPVHQLNMNHIPHFSQTAFPCWSILQSYPHVQKFMRFNGMVKNQLTSEWIQDLLHVFESQNITLLNHGQDVPMALNESVWYAQLTNGPFGGFPRQVESTKWGPKFELENAQYFLQTEHVHSLQKAILKEKYQESMNKLSNEPIRIVLIDRKNHTREWIHAQETKDAIEDMYDASEVVVDIVSNPSGSLQTQANTMHTADIIISPHGAQLTNLAFIRPCTAVLELFPRGYYLGYFQPLVISSGALSYDGYPRDRSHFVDSARVNNVKKREMIRKWEISTSPESIVRGLPEMISSLITCRNIYRTSKEASGVK
ncbi:hypothetical protein CTEN210_16095 [Chaetoceros tenuissimus]|uniref:Glycosyltransferase 61 catalytic domain-containing protein n=1 Tax=Chaetoceros tenuissimus TaxID=426638 RepID=A0AAD3D863_9STRA|nr:hypothetical protein CTEN210_16095 [Chaetoceros tenuissimus]